MLTHTVKISCHFSNIAMRFIKPALNGELVDQDALEKGLVNLAGSRGSRLTITRGHPTDILVDENVDGKVTFIIESSEEKPVKAWTSALVGATTDYFGYYTTSDREYWEEFEFFHSANTSMVLFIDEEIRYNSMDTLLSKEERQAVREKTGGMCKVKMHSGVFSTVKELTENCIAVLPE